MKALKKYLIYFIALNLIVLGFDKFFTFIPETCSLMTDLSKPFSYTIGIIEIMLGVLLFLGRFTKAILIFVILLMVWAIAMHLKAQTYDIGGAIFIAVLALIPLIIKDSKQ